jgi:hypothetical protein
VLDVGIAGPRLRENTNHRADSGSRSWDLDGGVVHRSARSRPLLLAEQERAIVRSSLPLVVEAVS